MLPNAFYQVLYMILWIVPIVEYYLEFIDDPYTYFAYKLAYTIKPHYNGIFYTSLTLIYWT